jgi:hypothetical protein
MTKTKVLILRLDVELLAKLDAYARQLSARADGARVTRSEAARIVLRDRFASKGRSRRA